MIFKRFSFRKKKPELSELRNVCEQDSNFLKGISSVKTKVFETQKQPSRGVPRRRRSENMQQIYRRTPMPRCYIYVHLGLGYFILTT